LYAIEGALLDCHWQEIPGERRSELVAQAEAAIAQLPPPRHKPAATPVTTTVLTADTVATRPDPDAPAMDGRYWNSRYPNSSTGSAGE
ncbi:MAG: TfoX/Sxy family DNA transformation protein, partial [Lysobacter sp.]|nr:TfoX/Sxy family DNA transformation protein [Lysobacter sp.]